MSKSIAIIPTPKCCKACKFHQTRYWLPLTTNRHGFICELDPNSEEIDVSCEDNSFKFVECPLKEVSEDEWGAEPNKKMNDLKYRPGDYVRYTIKNEVGKIKRLNALVDNHAFCWYHTGDTAASTSYDTIEPVLLQEQAEGMTHDEIAAYLHKQGFSNDYAVDAIIRKQEER